MLGLVVAMSACEAAYPHRWHVTTHTGIFENISMWWRL